MYIKKDIQRNNLSFMNLQNENEKGHENKKTVRNIPQQLCL